MAALMEVTQADRESAAQFLYPLGSGAVPTDLADLAHNIRRGRADDNRTVQAFARHRLAHSEPRPVAGDKLGWDEDGMCDDHYRFACPQCALATHSPAPTEAGDVERLRKLLSDLERSATAVYRKGITAGPQWSRLGGDLIRSRAALSSTQGGAEG